MVCPNCHYDNLEGVSKCGKCGENLVKKKVGCPKCATKNEIGIKKCKKCGYNFGKKSKMEIGIRFVLMILLIIFLCFLMFSKNINAVKNIQFIFSILAILAIFGLIIQGIIFSSKNKLDHQIPELFITNDKIGRLKKISYIMLGILVFIVIGVVVYFVFRYFK